MIRASLVALLMVVSCSAFAQWTEVISTEEATHFIDFNGVKKDGARRTFWVLDNFKQRDETGDLSAMKRVVINCNNETYQRISFSTFTAHFASGSGTYTNSKAMEVIHVMPNTVLAAIMRSVCSK
jgi:hypothetical protein